MAELLLKYLSWPAAAIILLLLIVVVLRTPLTEVLRRGGRKIGKDGLTIDQASAAAAASQQEAAPVEDALRLDPEAEQRLSHVKQAGVSPVIVEQQNRIKTDLQNLGLSCKKDEAIEVLVQHLAVQQLFHAAERIYRVIFGSQIDLLKALNIRGAMKITDIRPIYDHLGAQFPNIYNAYSFEAWLNYVKENNLVGTSDQLTYAITPLGQAFLQWMVLEGVTESKPF